MSRSVAIFIGWWATMMIIIVMLWTVYGCVTQPLPAPIIVQQAAPTPTPTPTPLPVPPDPRVGLSPEVLQALEDPEHPVVHQGMTLIAPYSADKEYKLTLVPLKAVEVRLNHDEVYLQSDLGDSSRWAAQGGQHEVLLKVLGDGSDPKMETNLIIETNKRAYHLALRLGRYVPSVAWYYPEDFEAALQTYQAYQKAHPANQPKP